VALASRLGLAVWDRKVARRLGVGVPPMLLALADEMLE
jgi:hypothetical protein